MTNWRRFWNGLVAVNNAISLVLVRVGDGIVRRPSLPFYLVLGIASALLPILGLFLLACMLTWALNRSMGLAP